MASVRLSVTGMTCDHCCNRVEDALKRVPGVYLAVVDLDDAMAEVEFDGSRANVQALIEAVQGAGYGAEVGD